MGAILDKLGESLKGVAAGVARGRDAAVCSAEKRLRTERIKVAIRELRAEKDKKMSQLSHKIYERYVNGTLQDEDLLADCQAIKMLQMQIDEHWTEVNSINGSEA